MPAIFSTEQDELSTRLLNEIYALRPVTFHYKREMDAQAIPQFGLVAEEVEAIDFIG